MAGKHGGGAWKVAYADFVTAMMAFFLVMWITAQSKPVKQAVAEYFEDPLGTNTGSRSTAISGLEDATTIGHYESGRGPGRSLAMANLKSSAPDNPQGVSAITPPRIIITRESDRTRSTGTLISFPDDANELDDRARERLSLLAPLLLGKPNLVEIRGRVSEVSATGPNAADDWTISYERCLAVMRFLADQGIQPERFRLSQTGAFEAYTILPGKEDGPVGSRVEVFALSEYARAYDQIHDVRIRRAELNGSPPAPASPTP